jgi:hypothetical protein
MANYKLNKTRYPRSIYPNVIDTTFEQTSPPLPIQDTVTVEQFFQFYNNLFYDIPADGDVNSHAYLVQKSGDYINFEGTSEDVQVLLDEISALQQENLNLSQQILQLQVSSSLNI